VGGDDVDQAGACLELRPAAGSETFTPLGNLDAKEHPQPGEIIYVVAESGEVMCRRWNWRNGHKTRITEETRTIVMNVDGLGEANESRTLITRDRVARMLEKYCQAEVSQALLSPDQMSYHFTL
jgi:lysyl-tRNA synthetase class 2